MARRNPCQQVAIELSSKRLCQKRTLIMVCTGHQYDIL
ncbi:hypothetical protein LTSEMON_1713 [Salmonella enterica subsp. enterica serovar Montevideo str. S5-403]|uniref:Uncharacterized protein n=1 Tax=Salmonella enterica subsp. enterica serovar Montevideo str. S5-403 TaxID=913242 RepID=G5Q1I7_SALMO|nr:hypothetical protein LTSEMON_1713 [Salmonella enterica subsp. enterica serovar Montevideo str. S5-403]